MAGVSDGPHSATCQYLENSPLVAQIAFAADGQTVMTTSKEYDALNRLTAIAWHPRGTPSPASVSFAYTYNAANQRIRRTESDSSYWLYTYDALGQVISGKKYWSDGTPVVGQQCEYAFDHIGNRRTNKFGGDGNGGNLRTALYSANNLNQYTSRTVPGYVNVLGEATDTASVSVNTNLAYRKDRYFRAELSVDNTAGPVWLGITNLAVMPVGGGNYVVSNVTGRVFLPKTPEAFTYDADGNLTQDGRWNYTWDAENRLVKVESRPDTPQASWRRVEWQYDGLGRRIRQITSDGSSDTWQVTEDLKFVSDPFLFGRHIAELNTANGALVRSYVWGLDLSGSLDGAGGVGGLLAVHDASTLNNQPSTHFVCYDGNGNVGALVNAADGYETARYEYGPFGEPLRQTGLMALENPFRFSTKRTDDTTDLVLYEYRVYNPSIGRWPNRDPIEEYGEIALYGIGRNDLVNHYDCVGLLGPLAGFAVDCIKEIAGALAIDWLKDQGDRVAACGLVFDGIRSKNTHIGCNGELVIPSSPFMHNEERKGWGSRIARCLWSKIKSKGIGNILKDLPEGVEKELLEEALGGGIDNLEDATKITDATHQIRATCDDKGINVSVFTQITLTLGQKTFNLRTDEKKPGKCLNLDAGSVYDLGCRCCAKSPYHPDYPKGQ